MGVRIRGQKEDRGQKTEEKRKHFPPLEGEGGFSSFLFPLLWSTDRNPSDCRTAFTFPLLPFLVCRIIQVQTLQLATFHESEQIQIVKES